MKSKFKLGESVYCKPLAVWSTIETIHCNNTISHDGLIILGYSLNDIDYGECYWQESDLSSEDAKG